MFSFIRHRIIHCMGRNERCLNITESWFMSLKMAAEKLKTNIKKNCSEI